MLSDPLLRSTDDIAPVWVLDDPRSGTASQAIGIAERLGVPHLRVPLNWNWLAHIAALSSAGSLKGLSGGPGWPFTAPRGPAMTLSAGSRSEAVALWMRSRFGARIVHCMKPKYGHANRFDLLVVPQHDKPKNRPNVLPVLGTPHRLSPLALSQARVAWAGRLSHLPRPLVTLLVGGSNGEAEMRPSFAHALGRQAAQLAQAAGGAVLATTSRRTGVEATAALAAGLASAMHLLYRWGEPGENPYEGYLGLADAIIVTGDSVSMISEACGAEAPVFIAGSDNPGRLRALHASLYEAHQARPLGDTLVSWTRTPLDEAGRVASAIRSRMALGPQAVD
jgi:mitochondrial fission protein ELM1